MLLMGIGVVQFSNSGESEETVESSGYNERGLTVFGVVLQDHKEIRKRKQELTEIRKRARKPRYDIEKVSAVISHVVKQDGVYSATMLNDFLFETCCVLKTAICGCGKGLPNLL